MNSDWRSRNIPKNWFLEEIVFVSYCSPINARRKNWVPGYPVLVETFRIFVVFRLTYFPCNTIWNITYITMANVKLLFTRHNYKRNRSKLQQHWNISAIRGAYCNVCNHEVISLAHDQNHIPFVTRAEHSCHRCEISLLLQHGEKTSSMRPNKKCFVMRESTLWFQSHSYQIYIRFVTWGEHFYNVAQTAKTP